MLQRRIKLKGYLQISIEYKNSNDFREVFYYLVDNQFVWRERAIDRQLRSSWACLIHVKLRDESPIWLGVLFQVSLLLFPQSTLLKNSPRIIVVIISMKTAVKIACDNMNANGNKVRRIIKFFHLNVGSRDVRLSICKSLVMNVVSIIQLEKQPYENRNVCTR